ncbi:hypothetical protein O4H49_03410 [Kiloniella laminariae]|uniref:Uncharacterized protein n=1 Tax=Kiloniella laminariae TaxID=454162 RepID=A0ABT4LFU5_9PROT|nr:hypothetical protein [Kiloniella laminariae]MCZ4279810.1 hypothetical protein [Kiloniella laminariae]
MALCAGLQVGKLEIPLTVLVPEPGHPAGKSFLPQYFASVAPRRERLRPDIGSCFAIGRGNVSSLLIPG